MALAVQAVLTQAGYRIPEDLFLTGFDDYHAQTLSTVKQSPFLQMRSAVELLLDRVRNGAPPRTVTIPAVPVVRSSCGCLPEARFDRYRREHQADTAYADRLDRLQKAFVASVRSPGSRTFVLELDTVLGDPAVGEPEDFWRSLEQSMRNRCLGTLAAEGRRDEAEHLLALGRFLAEERNLGLKSESLHVVSRQAFQLRETAEALGNSRTIQETFDLVARELPPLGVRACWLSLLDDASLQSSTLRLAFDEGGRVDLPADGVRFPSRQLIPGGCRSIGTGHWLLFAEVLQAKDEVFGVLVLSVTLQGASLCEALRSHISVAIQGAKLWEDRDRNERRIIENEKMSALGALVAGVAHEINTPLGNGIMAASDLRDRVADLIRRSQEDRLSREGFAKALADLEEESRLIESNLARAGDLVSSFKQVAVDQTYEESRWFSLADYLRYIVLSHKSKLKPGNHRCQWDCPPEIALFGPPGTLAQVVSNLIENAVSHGFEGRQGGTIRITCFQEEGRVHITVADDGVGIPPSQTGRIFEPFYTTKRGRGGTGLGLAIVHNLVRKVWNGTLECSSVVGQGTEFRLTLPVPDPLR
jgi:signal transduction histidine kinase